MAEEFKIVEYTLTKDDFAVVYKLFLKVCILYITLVVIIMSALFGLSIANTINKYDVVSIPLCAGCSISVVGIIVAGIVICHAIKKRMEQQFERISKNGIVEYSIYLMPDYIGLINKTIDQKHKFYKNDPKIIFKQKNFFILIIGKLVIVIPRNEVTEEYFRIKKKQ